MIPVSLSNGVEPGARTGTLVQGRRIALWRGESGRVHAWQDRCPHRGMRLSFGFVRDERLACIYHGWAFDADGRCVAIPAQPDLAPPANIAVPSFPVAESHGMVWVGLEEDDTPPPSAEGFHPVRSITVRVPAADLLDALRGAAPPRMRCLPAGPSLVAFEGAGARVLAGVQARSDESASAHVAVSSSDASLRKALCAWAVKFRSRVAV